MDRDLDQKDLQALEKIDGSLKVATNLKSELENDLKKGIEQDVNTEHRSIMLGLLIENLEIYRLKILNNGLNALDETARNDYEKTLDELDRLTEAVLDF